MVVVDTIFHFLEAVFHSVVRLLVIFAKFALFSVSIDTIFEYVEKVTRLLLHNLFPSNVDD